jgi:glycosyltransferase involved in cell wall biosynthesis
VYFVADVYNADMLSVIIATQGQEQPAVATLAALVPGAAAGVIRDVVLVDRGGSDTIARVADIAGCHYIASNDSRAAALAAGAAQARSPWLMFMHAGAVLDSGWIEETSQFVQSVSLNGEPRAASFRYARSPYTPTNWRDALRWIGRTFGSPSTDQGLLIAREHYERLGGFNPDAQRAESRLLKQLGRSSRTLLRSRIVVS